jgi:hypothetical protein
MHRKWRKEERENGKMVLEVGNRESWAEFERGRAYKGKETTKGRGTQRQKDPGMEIVARPITNKHDFFFARKMIWEIFGEVVLLCKRVDRKGVRTICVVGDTDVRVRCLKKCLKEQ